jgi:hypothetical protein
MTKGSFGLMTLLLVLFICPAPARGQADVSSATLKGTVVDPNGSVVAGATVTVTSVDRGIAKTVKSNSEGVYHIPLLQPGAYRLDVEAQGFAKEQVKNVQLTVGEILVYDVHLRVGGVTTVVDVTTDAPLLEVEQTQQANTINQRQVEDLPNIGRNFTQAVFTLPGVAPSEATRVQNPGFTGFVTTGFSIGGSNGRNNLSTIDGGENEYGTGQYRVGLSVDSIQEFQVNRNAFAAEFGFTVGSAVNIVTKSGTNHWHGSGYGYFRNSSTEAQNYFNRFFPDANAYSQHVFAGGTFGGPIKTDKLFFFTSYEFNKLDLPGTNVLLNTDASLGVNGNSLNDVTQRNYLNTMIASGGPVLAGLATAFKGLLVPQNNPNFLKMLSRDNGPFDNLTKTHTWLTRVDYQPNSTNALNFRFELAHNLFGLQTYPDGQRLDTRDYSILTNWSRTISPTMVNQFRSQIVPWNRANTAMNSLNGDWSVIVDSGFPAASAGQGAGVALFGHSFAVPYLAHQRRFQFEDNLVWTKGAHTLKFGASYRPVDYHLAEPLWFSGEFDFLDGLIPIVAIVPSALQPSVVAFNLAHGFPATGPALTGAEDFTLGLPVQWRQGFHNFAWQGWAHYFGSFAQDSWKISPRFTLDFGARFDVDGEPSPLKNYFYVSPRLGFAWDPWGNQKTVIRGGAGIFESPIDVLIPSYASILDNSGRYINEVLRQGVGAIGVWQAGLAAGILPFNELSESFVNSLGIPTGAGNPGRDVYGVDPNYRNPYAIQANLAIQRELVRNLSLEVAYTMYHGLHLQMPVESNYKETGVVDPFLGPIYTKIDPTIEANTVYRSIGKSIYHGMTVSLTKRYSSHLQFQANYTYSKTIDDAIDFASFQNWFRPSRINLYRAVSVFDFTHVFVANAVYTTPFESGSGHNFLARALADVTIAPILTMRSGIPFSVRTPSMVNGLPDGPLLDSNYATPFAAGRDTSRGYPYYTLDLRIQKTLLLARERGIKLNVIAEGTNILNRANFNKVNDVFPAFAGPVQVAGGGTVNLATGPYNLKGVVPHSLSELSLPLAFQSADLPRQVQFGLRIVF